MGHFSYLEASVNQTLSQAQKRLRRLFNPSKTSQNFFVEGNNVRFTADPTYQLRTSIRLAILEMETKHCLLDKGTGVCLMR